MHTSTHELAQRISDQQTTIARLRVERDAEQLTAYRMSERVTELAAQVVVLRSALENVQNIYVGEDGDAMCAWCEAYVHHGGHAPDCQRQAALADPSPAVDAVREIFKLVDVMMLELWEWAEVRDASIIDMLARPGVNFDKHLEKIADAWDAYRDVTRGDDPARGSHVEPRGPGGE